MTDYEKRAPQPGETWLHTYHGPVKIVRRWNEDESVCEDANGRRRLLHHALMEANLYGAGSVVMETINVPGALAIGNT